MIRSMTGYGRAEGRHKGTPITVEVRSVNHRHSEVMAKLPRALQAHEDRIRDLVQDRVARGRVDVTVNFRDRKSTRLNSSHLVISYAVFCLKKKKKKKHIKQDSQGIKPSKTRDIRGQVE